MGWKQKITLPRKNEERKRHHLRHLNVSIPLSLVIIRPLSVYQLQAQLNNSLPAGWVDISGVIAQSSEPHSSDMVLSKPRCITTPPGVDMGLTLCVSSDFSWKLFLSSLEICHCTLLANSPQRVRSVRDVVVLLTTLDSMRICDGNSDAKFLTLSLSHKGVFMDSHGM